MKERPALLIMDMQQRIVENYGGTRQQVVAVDKARLAAREAGIPVIYVVLQLAGGYPDLHPRNRPLRPLSEAGLFTEEDPGARIIDELAPLAGDIVVTKKRQSAFTGGSLEITLRSLEISHLVLTGVSTSGVVLSTIRQAADLDYGVTVLSDGCGDPDDQVQDLLMNRVFPHQGDVKSVAEWVSELSPAVLVANSPR